MKAGKDLRRVLQIGESTGITLPAEYLKLNNIERGDKVEVVFSGEVVKVQPFNEEEIRKRVEEEMNGK